MLSPRTPAIYHNIDALLQPIQNWDSKNHFDKTETSHVWRQV
jgi:hypothetical protein